jgi:hypothetical protein
MEGVWEMFDVFTEEIEVTIKEGITNLYWYKNDLKRVWLRAGVDPALWDALTAKPGYEGGEPTKRQLMGYLYEELRESDPNRRLEISRNFVRILQIVSNYVLDQRLTSCI